MLFSWNQLTDYLRLSIPHEELADRLSLVGFNHESTREVGGDLCIDLEITSNRPDCLNHLGIAREIGLLLGQPVTFPVSANPEVDAHNEPAVRVENRAGELCSRFEAITVHGVKVGASPSWLVKRLETLGFRSINNVVDVSNYVMSETGQPIHAYDLDKLEGRTLIVRTAASGETADCLDHKRYELDESTLVISDMNRVVSLAGIMGGADSEVGESTTNIVIETARFDPINIRRTSRGLGLQTQSSFRFERPIDPSMVLWARNRCVELIKMLAGGVVQSASHHAASIDPTPPPVTLRVDRVARLLGIEVSLDEIKRILDSLGLILVAEDADTLSFETPIWRCDLDREVDLIEEIGRIHGYDQIPEDRPVTLSAIRQDRRGRVEGEIRSLLVNLGYSEAITYSFVAKEFVGGEFSSQRRVEPIRVEHATRKQSNLMRLSLTPSLLEAASYNEAHGNFGVRLFEVGNVYQPIADRELPEETTRLAHVSPGDFFQIKGVLEALVSRLHIATPLVWQAATMDGLKPGHTAEVWLGPTKLGFAGELASGKQGRLKLRGKYSVLEISLDALEVAANLIPQNQNIPVFPGVQRDLSLIVPVRTTWASIEQTVLNAVDSTFEGMTFEDSFRGGQLGKDEQSIHFSLRFRNPEKTMTTDEIDGIMNRIIRRCQDDLGATIRG